MGQIVFSPSEHSSGAPDRGRTIITFSAKVDKIRGTERGTGFLLTVTRNGSQTTIKSSFDRAGNCEADKIYVFSCHHNTSTKGEEPAAWTLAGQPLLKASIF